MINLNDNTYINPRSVYEETRTRALERGKDKVGRHWHRGYCWEVWREGVHGSGLYRAQCVGSDTNDRRPPKIAVIGKEFGDVLREIDKSLDDMQRLNDKSTVEFGVDKFNPVH